MTYKPVKVKRQLFDYYLVPLGNTWAIWAYYRRSGGKVNALVWVGPENCSRKQAEREVKVLQNKSKAERVVCAEGRP